MSSPRETIGPWDALRHADREEEAAQLAAELVATEKLTQVLADRRPVVPTTE